MIWCSLTTRFNPPGCQFDVDSRTLKWQVNVPKQQGIPSHHPAHPPRHGHITCPSQHSYLLGTGPAPSSYPSLPPTYSSIPHQQQMPPSVPHFAETDLSQIQNEEVGLLLFNSYFSKGSLLCSLFHSVARIPWQQCLLRRTSGSKCKRLTTLLLGILQLP